MKLIESCSDNRIKKMNYNNVILSLVNVIYEMPV